MFTLRFIITKFLTTIFVVITVPSQITPPIPKLFRFEITTEGCTNV